MRPDLAWLRLSLLQLAPLVLAQSAAHAFGMRMGDYSWHLNFTGDPAVSAYAPGVSMLVGSLAWLMPRDLSLFVWGLLLTTLIPFVLIHAITRDTRATWAYCFLSGIPLVLSMLWFIPQAAVMCMMLATWLWPPFGLTFVFLGPLFHKEWILCFLLTAAGKLWYETTKGGKAWS